MLNTIKTHILLPLMGRVGTATAALLVGYGVQGDLAYQVGAYVIAGSALVYDLIADWYVNRRVR
ncbi:hypothetical protein ACFOOL_14260 [Devosia honganensis]|uniref:Uncharacterized protein n=1 Tax=Devosia honganensis TaxID=1610527 RepID=A0ABV7X3K8_9HYPH